MRRLPPTFAVCIILVIAIAMSGVALAQTGLQSLQAIRDAAIAALRSEPGSQAMVAPGLRLAECTQPLVASPAGAATAEVRCADAPGWRLFVPVRRKPVARQQPGASALTAGGTTPVTAPAETAAPAVTVKRGDPVVLRASFGGTEVRMGGRALGPAVAGATVNVENESSHRIVRGRLAPDGTVEVVN